MGVAVVGCPDPVARSLQRRGHLRPGPYDLKTIFETLFQIISPPTYPSLLTHAA